MSKKLPKDYYLYEPPYQTNVPSSQYYTHHFDALPSKYKLAKNYSYETIDYLKTNGYDVVIKNSTRVARKNKTTEEFLMVNNDDRTMIEINYDPERNGSPALDVSFLYDVSTTVIEINPILHYIMENFTMEEKHSDIKLLKNESGFIDTEDFTLKKPIVDIALNYGEEFVKVHEVIVEKLNKEHSSGIVLLHGDIGSGKCVVAGTKVKIRNKKTGKISEINIEDLM